MFTLVYTNRFFHSVVSRHIVTTLAEFGDE